MTLTLSMRTKIFIKTTDIKDEKVFIRTKIFMYKNKIFRIFIRVKKYFQAEQNV